MIFIDEAAEEDDDYVALLLFCSFALLLFCSFALLLCCNGIFRKLNCHKIIRWK